MLYWNCSYCSKPAYKCWFYTDRQNVRPYVIRYAEKLRAVAMVVQELLAGTALGARIEYRVNGYCLKVTFWF